MNVLYPSEFKSRYNGELKDYIDYLQTKRDELELVLQTAEELSLDSSATDEVRQDLKIILNITSIIETNLASIVSRSVDNLTTKELREFLENDKTWSDEEKSQLIDSISNTKRELALVISKIENAKTRDKERQERFRIRDVKVFFEKHSISDYVKCILRHALPTNFKELVLTAIETEFTISKIEISADELEEFANKIVDIIKRAQDILLYSNKSDTLEKITAKILSKYGICSPQVLPENVSHEIGLNILKNLMNQYKTKTEFFKALPDEIKTLLVEERFESCTYRSLCDDYEKTLRQEELESYVSNNDLNERSGLETLLAQQKTRLSEIKALEEQHKQFLCNKIAMRDRLKELIMSYADSAISLEELNAAIKETQTERMKLKDQIMSSIINLENKQSQLNSVTRILKDEGYQEVFTAVNNRNTQKIYASMGIFVHEDSVKPFLDAEKKRLNLIELVIDFKFRLNNIVFRIVSLKKTTNSFAKLFPDYKKKMDELTKSYNYIIESFLDRLKKDDLCQIKIETPTLPEQCGLITLESQNSTITDLNQLRSLEQSFWDINTGVDSETKNAFLTEAHLNNEWDNYRDNLTNYQRSLLKALLTFEYIDGLYYNTLSDEQCKDLTNVQTTIIRIAESSYKNRKKYREEIETASTHIDEQKSNEIEAVLGKIGSREDLEEYESHLRLEIKKILDFLLERINLSKSLDIVLPIQYSEMPTQIGIDLDARIKSLGIVGVTTLESAIEYENILNSLLGFNTNVKRFYIQKNSK